MRAEEAIKLIIDNQFILDCPQILLTPQLSDSTRKGYSGPGFISQNNSGALTFKIFCTEGSPFEDLRNYFNITPGKIIGDEHYYDLLATDINGRQWEARRIDPDTNSGRAGFIAQGKINEISHIYHIPKSVEGYFADIYFPGDIDIPCNSTSTVEKFIGEKSRLWSGNRNVAKFDACGFDFELEQEKNFLLFGVQSKSKEISSATIIRFTEALQFVLARSLSWSVLEVIHNQNVNVKIRPLNKNDTKMVIGPPISLGQCRDKPDIIWILFQKYLEYVIDCNNESWHPLFSWVYKVIESEASPIDIEALARSVAIEGILNSEFSDLKNIDSKLQTQICKANKIIFQSDLEDNYKKRLAGALSSMFKPRAKDRLHILKEKGFLDEALIDEYGKLRDSSTHGSLSFENHPQKYINRFNSVLVLFYHLIFTVIGYKGPYTDYSTLKFPLKDFGIGLS